MGLLLNAGGLIGRELMGSSRPKYRIPQSARESLSRARILADDTVSPVEQRQLDEIALSTANAVRAAQESGNALETVASIQGQQDRATRQVMADSAADQRRDIEMLMRALGQTAEREDLQFQMNEFAPFAERQQEVRDIFGAAAQNAAGIAEKQRVLDMISKMSGSGPASQSSVGQSTSVNPDGSITTLYDADGSWTRNRSMTSSLTVLNPDGTVNQRATDRANRRAARAAKISSGPAGVTDDVSPTLSLLMQLLGSKTFLP